MEDKQKERRDDNLANRRLLRRTLILMAICGVLIFIPVLAKLWNLQITRHDELEQMAVTQQTSTQAITAPRGTIYDTNGNVLAISATAYDVIISPKAIADLPDGAGQEEGGGSGEKRPEEPRIPAMTRTWRSWWSRAWPTSSDWMRPTCGKNAPTAKASISALTQKVDADVREADPHLHRRQRPDRLHLPPEQYQALLPLLHTGQPRSSALPTTTAAPTVWRPPSTMT